MKKIVFSNALLLCIALCFPAQSQIIKSTKQLLTDSKLTTEQEQNHSDSIIKRDSVNIEELTIQLQEMKLNEIMLKSELEKVKTGSKQIDSIRYQKQIAKIDSLKKQSKGIPVVIEEDTLFILYAKKGGLSPSLRAKNIQTQITDLGKEFNVKPDSIYVFETENFIDIMYRDQVIMSITEQDALWQNKTREQLAIQYRNIVVDAVKMVKEKYGLTKRIIGIVLVLLVVFAQYLLIKLTYKFYRLMIRRIIRLKYTKLTGLKIKDYEFLNPKKQVIALVNILKFTRYLLIGLQLLISVPIIFSIFPETKYLANKFLNYLLTPAKEIIHAVIDYIPELITIIVIYLCIHYIIKGIRYLATEIASENLKISGFYPDWAMPTYQIIRALLYAFMIVLIYPYLPANDSDIFKGVSVFVGLIISLGSSTVIGNIIAGLVITYMRPFKLGDRIKLNDTVGNVIEKTPFVTRVRTPKNEIITIPNSFIMSTLTTNYTASANNYGLIIHSNVTIGYDAEWRDVHRLLIEAAKATRGIQTKPEPFVLETELSDFYPVYQINGYITDVNRIAGIYSELHQNIQDKFNEAGIQIMSPNYEADTPEPAIPMRYRKK